jgi:hypothetical protein
MLASFGKEGWNNLAPAVRLRLERAITNDILAGHFDVYGPNIGNQGALGTFSQTFWPYFSDLELLVDNIVARLKSGWYGQNYVGQYLFWLLPHLGHTMARRKKLIDAVAYAVRNDAIVIRSKIELLPHDWQNEITAQNKPAASAEQSSIEDDDIPF